jgi:hypothetical protein
LGYEPLRPFRHEGAVLALEEGEFPGRLLHRFGRMTGAVGIRRVFGLVWRPFVGLELGLGRRQYQGLVQLEVSQPQEPLDYGLPLPDFETLEAVPALVFGLEWQFDDRWSLVLAPRVEAIGGTRLALGLSAPVGLAYSFYP